MNFFQLADSFVGEIYFQVSKHLSKPVSWVIKYKYSPDVKFLIFKYIQIAKRRQEEYEEMKDEYDL